jgi:hypothetical protein
MRRLMKFLHTMGAIGITGAMASMLVVLAFTPSPEALHDYVLMRSLLGGIAQWLLLPSMTLVLFSGLLAMAMTTAFHSAGWVVLKLISGMLVFKGVLLSIQGPAEHEAALGAAVLAGEQDPSVLGVVTSGEWGALWVIIFVAVANVVLGVWRPRFSRAARPRAPSTTITGDEGDRASP